MDSTDLQAYVGLGDDPSAFDVALCASAWEAAEALVTQFVGASDVPEEVLDRAYLEVGSELYHRKNAPNGVAQFSTFDAAPIRVARDPMVAARPILASFLTPGIA
ncbi:MAG: hypothetical protein JWP75_3882 [Frondihabitans sp.]|nr:hypothetical protein [Frondihabitans sp.]